MLWEARKSVNADWLEINQYPGCRSSIHIRSSNGISCISTISPLCPEQMLAVKNLAMKVETHILSGKQQDFLNVQIHNIKI